MLSLVLGWLASHTFVLVAAGSAFAGHVVPRVVSAVSSWVSAKVAWGRSVVAAVGRLAGQAAADAKAEADKIVGK